MAPRSPATDPLSVRESGGGPHMVFKVLFWVHQIVLGFPSIGFGLDLLLTAKLTES